MESYNNSVLTSNDMLQRLAAVDFVVTMQSLRNWEKDGLVTPPFRTSGYGGRQTYYSEYALAECYAAHMLLHVLPKKIQDKSIPKFSIEMLAAARAKCGSCEWKDIDSRDLAKELCNQIKLKDNSIDAMLDFCLALSADFLWFKY